MADPLSLVRKIFLVSNHAVLNFEFGRRGAHIDELVGHLHELVEIQRPIIERARQTKTVLDEHGFARAVALVHAPDLRHGGMRFVDHCDEILGKEIDDRIRLGAGCAPG